MAQWKLLGLSQERQWVYGPAWLAGPAWSRARPNMLRDLLPAVGQEEEYDQEGMGLPVVTWGCSGAWMPILLPGWGWHFLWAQEPLSILQPQLLPLSQSGDAD